jgi:hypothetical protein
LLLVEKRGFNYGHYGTICNRCRNWWWRWLRGESLDAGGRVGERSQERAIEYQGGLDLRHVTSAIDFTNSGDTDEPIWIRGYSSAIGDGGKPVLSCTSGGRIACTASHVHYSDFRINGSPTSGTPLFKLSTSEAALYNVDVDGSDQTTSHVMNIDGYGTLCRVSVKGGTGSTLVYGGVSATACSFSGGTTGMDTSGSIIGCQFRGMTTAIDLSVANKRSTVAFNTFYDVGTAFYTSNTPSSGDCSVAIVNNLMYSISDYAINNDSSHAQIFLLVNNAMGAVTSGRLNGFDDQFEHDPIILTADPFTLTRPTATSG